MKRSTYETMLQHISEFTAAGADRFQFANGMRWMLENIREEEGITDDETSGQDKTLDGRQDNGGEVDG